MKIDALITSKKPYPHFKYFFLNLILIFLCPEEGLSQETYYIDPDYQGENRTGHMESPFTSFEDFTFRSNTAYFIKRSTNIVLTTTLSLDEDNVTIGAYGEGDSPQIFSEVEDGNRVMVIRGDYCNLENLEITAKDNGPENSAGVVVDIIEARNTRLENVHTRGGDRGINCSKTVGTTTLLNCRVEQTWDDGMYHRDNEAIIIENCHIQKVNLKYLINPVQTYAGGDCIQFDFIDYFEIRECNIDKTYTGGKFAVIADHFGYGIIENNDFSLSEKQHGVYLGIGENLIFRYNNMTGGQYGVWNKTAEVEMAYNIIKNTSISAYYGGDRTRSQIYNNLFIRNKNAIFGWAETMNVHNNIFYLNEINIDGNREIIYSDFNCFYPADENVTEPNSIETDPLFIDPDNDDYSLDPNSPCIDAGIDVGETTDMKDYPVPNGDNPDLGPNEYNDGPFSNNIPKSTFKIFPNPSQGSINLSFKEYYFDKVSAIRIYSSDGELLYGKQLTLHSQTIEVPYKIYESGIYFVRVFYGYNIPPSSRSFIIEK